MSPRRNSISEVQASQRRSEVGRMSAAGASLAEIRDRFGLQSEASARQIITAAIRHGHIRRADVPDGVLRKEAPPPAVKYPTYTATEQAADWRNQAVCRDPLVNLEAFHPIGYVWGTSTASLAREAEAKAACRGCPVTWACEAAAEAAGDIWSIRGGKTPDERRGRGRTRRRTA